MPDRFVRRKLEDEEIWLDLAEGRYYSLNESGAAILDAWSQGLRDPQAIAARLVERFDVSIAEAVRAVEAFLVDPATRTLIAS